MLSAKSRRDRRSLWSGVLLLALLVGCFRSSAEAQPAAQPEQPAPEIAAVAAKQPPAPPAPVGSPQVVKEPAFDKTKKVVGEAGDAAGKVGDAVKEKTTHAILEMQAARYFISLAPADELYLYEQVKAMNAVTASSLSVVADQTHALHAKIHLIGKEIEGQILRGEGPARELRLKFAELERTSLKLDIAVVLNGFELRSQLVIGSKVTDDRLHMLPFGLRSEKLFDIQREQLLKRMTRGEGPTAADVLKLIHRSSSLTKDFRGCQVLTSKVHETLVLAYPGDWTTTTTGEVFYGYPGQSADKCVSHRLSTASNYISTLYAHAKYLHELYLSNSPDKVFKFDYPGLTPKELAEAEQMLEKMREARPSKPPGRLELVPEKEEKK